jgi:hypothetical protein
MCSSQSGLLVNSFIGWRHRETQRLLLLIAMVLFTLSCTPRGDERSEMRAATRIHELISLRKFDEIESAADPAFRNAVSREQTREGFRKLANDCGRYLSAVLLDRRQMEYGDGGALRVSVLTLQTHYERGSLREQFFFRSNSESPRLVAFRYNGSCSANAGASEMTSPLPSTPRETPLQT